ncbi:MAG: SWIM zinc finger family protein [Candidatus Methanoperedens sp.]|nr:SWIM zinc finger family protein [Candidatus Methanoperedens sp.]
MARGDFYFWGGYTPSKPIRVEGGIKAKSKRGGIGDTWWSKRWVNILESFGWTNRLERGRRYARGGQVLDFKLTPGKVTARVQGSVSTPYSVSIEIRTLDEDAWVKITEEMSQKAIFAAKLLAGEMPQNIEEAFKSAGMSLLPESSKDIKTDCSCPDSANPCKHIAAVYYILAEEFDRDPFMIFNLRGKTKEDITVSLRMKRTIDTPGIPDQKDNVDVPAAPIVPEFPLEEFWNSGELGSFSVNIAAPDVSTAVIKRLGTPQFWDSGEDFSKKMSGYYEKISRRAIDTAYGEQSETPKKKKKKSLLKRI